MSLLDDARRLRDLTPDAGSGDGCVYCASWSPHEPDCPTLSLPQIVAALEMLERHGIDFDEHEYDGALVLGISSDCYCFDEPVIHRTGCQRRADTLSGPTEPTESTHLTGPPI